MDDNQFGGLLHHGQFAKFCKYICQNYLFPGFPHDRHLIMLEYNTGYPLIMHVYNLVLHRKHVNEA